MIVECINIILLSLVALATIITVIYTILQFNALRSNRREDFERTFSIRKIVISEYRPHEQHKQKVSIELTNKNGVQSLSVNGVVLTFKNNEKITAHIDKKVQQSFYLGPKEWGELEVSITDKMAQYLKGKEAILTVYDTDEKPASEKIILREDTFFYPSKNS